MVSLDSNENLKAPRLKNPIFNVQDAHSIHLENVSEEEIRIQIEQTAESFSILKNELSIDHINVNDGLWQS